MDRTLFATLLAVTAVLFAALAAVADVRTRRIPNRLVLLAVPTALLLQFATAGWPGVASATAAALIASVLMSFAYLLGGVGAGDVKLLGAMGAFAGVGGLPLLLLSTALAGGVFGILLLLRRVRLPAQWRGNTSHTGVPRPAPVTLPYGVPIGCGVVAVLCRTLWSLA